MKPCVFIQQNTEPAGKELSETQAENMGACLLSFKAFGFIFLNSSRVSKFFSGDKLNCLGHSGDLQRLSLLSFIEAVTL